MGLRPLGELKTGESGQIVKIGGEGADPARIRRLLEMGLVEGAGVEVVHEAPVSRDPIAVRVRGAKIALRRDEAGWVQVEDGKDAENG